MSDQGPTSQPPGAPQPPAVPGYVPQPPAPPAGFEQPAAPGPASSPKKRRIWVIVAVAVAVLVCLPAACLGTFAVTAAREQARVNDAVAQAEDHYNSATDALEQASESMAAYGDTGSQDAADAAETRIRSARDELAAARAAIEPLDDSPGRSAYLSSLDSATQSIEGIETLVATMRLLSQLSGQITQGSTAVRRADALLDQAIDAGNDGKYSVMRSRGLAASRSYATASAIFVSAHKLEPSGGLDTVVEYIRLRKSQADLAVRMAADGLAGRVAEYNKQVKTQRTLDDRAEKTGEPAIVTDPNWFEDQIAEQTTAFEDAGEKADELRAAALDELGYTGE